jgi:hypothetical protein
VAWLLAFCIGNWLGWYVNYTCHRRVHARFEHAKKPRGLNESGASPFPILELTGAGPGSLRYCSSLYRLLLLFMLRSVVPVSCLPPSDTAWADCIYQVCSALPRYHRFPAKSCS